MLMLCTDFIMAERSERKQDFSLLSSYNYYYCSGFSLCWGYFTILQRLMSLRNRCQKDHFAMSCVQGFKNVLHQRKQKWRITCCSTTIPNTGKEQFSQSLMNISEKTEQYMVSACNTSKQYSLPETQEDPICVQSNILHVLVLNKSSWNCPREAKASKVPGNPQVLTLHETVW